jgi:Fe-S cluster assembly protein SufD
MSAVINRSMADFERLSTTLPGQELPWLAALRKSGLQRFRNEGLPTPRDEAWRHTSLMALAGKPFEPVASEPGDDIAINASRLLPADELPHLVFIDGHYSAALSRLPDLPEGVRIDSLATLLREDPAALESMLGDIPAEPLGFAALNTAFMSDGLCLRLAAGATLAQPLYVVHVTRAGERPTAIHLRHLIQAGRGARATVIEHYLGEPGTQALISAMTRCDLDEGAAIEHYRLNEQESGVYLFAATHAHQARDSRYTGHVVHAGGRIARNELHAFLEAPGAECVANGLYLGNERQTVDNYVSVEHLAPDCSSRQLFRGVLDDRSRGVFNGKVTVAREAQHTDAQQMNNNLLLSEDAEADSRPQLTINADDVKCSHGSTVGQIDADALFYLRTRGLSEPVARAILVRAFAQEVLAHMGEEMVRQRIGEIVDARLGARTEA